MLCCWEKKKVKAQNYGLIVISALPKDAWKRWAGSALTDISGFWHFCLHIIFFISSYYLPCFQKWAWAVLKSIECLQLMFQNFYTFIYFACASRWGAHLYVTTCCGGQRMTCGIQFCPFTMWVLGLRLGLRPLPTEPSHQPLKTNLYL